MRLVPAAAVRAADAAAPRLGVDAATLMANAGRAVADAVLATDPRRVVVACGPGNNGGDGYVAARHLADAGLDVRVLALDPDRSRGDAAEAARAAWAARGPLAPLDPDRLAADLTDADQVVDALLGSGLDRPLRGPLADVVAHLNAADVPVLAVDVPTGIDADVATPPGPHVRATRTVQLAWACPASALAPARFAFGPAPVAAIGMPAGALPDDADPAAYPERTGDADAARAWPPAARDAHKYAAGTVLILAGSPAWAGAGELAARGAHRAGAGLVTLLSDAPHPARWPETITPVVDAAPGGLARAWSDVAARHRAAQVIGPGLAAERLPELAAVLERDATPTVLDATALDPSLHAAVASGPGRWLTPHHGEAARLLEASADAVRRDPIDAARRLAATWNAGVVLKGAGAVLASPDGRVRVVAGGHPGMAAGGTGDVLAGAIGAALAAPHDDALARVAAAVLVHARAGERAAARHGSGLRAGDVADALGTTREALAEAC
ncbi:MAG: NAD(P)H-hydrate dehydratase [Trueperaceae bacterium]|nr:NAD(P)H-hydrate dehydratase [Trueperaceae bacterium]